MTSLMQAGVNGDTIPALSALLKRHPAIIDNSAVSSKLTDKAVLVTGAAGSVGSELCRQIAQFRPAALVGLDIAESPLFQLDLEMSRELPAGIFRPEVGNIQNCNRLRDIFTAYRPSIVFHAAGYKHVPLMEAHPFEAIENNVFGTRNLVSAARDFDVATLVMISSDKAVRPSSIMGATKRIAEMVVQCSGYVSVRFGNVIGSSGSVFQVFKEQIARGGPVTITDPEMRRFFTTASDACRLVLQASAMAEGAEIFALEMGEPVKITDLTNELIRLSGVEPGRDVEITFTQPRPGEKLIEEMAGAGETLLPTSHEQIREVTDARIADVCLESRLEVLREVCTERNLSSAIPSIRGLVPDYSPDAFEGTQPSSARARVAAV